MTSAYYVLVYCSGLDNDLEQDELIQTLEERVTGLYDSHSNSPTLDNYLRPAALGGGKIIFGCQNPEEIISYAEKMHENVTEAAWKAIDKHKEKIVSKTVNHQECRALSKAFDALAGNVNDETDTFVISSWGAFDAWPDDEQLNKIKNNPNQWALCWVEFKYID